MFVWRYACINTSPFTTKLYWTVGYGVNTIPISLDDYELRSFTKYLTSHFINHNLLMIFIIVESSSWNVISNVDWWKVSGVCAQAENNCHVHDKKGDNWIKFHFLNSLLPHVDPNQAIPQSKKCANSCSVFCCCCQLSSSRNNTHPRFSTTLSPPTPRTVTCPRPVFPSTRPAPPIL